MDYKDIQEQFNKVISYSQRITNPNTDDLFERWYKAKNFFIEKFGGLIWESPNPVSFSLGAQDRNIKIDNFVANTVVYKYQNYDLARFINYEKDGFFDNVVSLEYRTVNDTIIPKGMKLVKAFKFFEENPQILDNLQTAASMLIQETKIEGKLCFSVHPLDFISCSENQYNWRSCHALDGEYRAGNLSYMVDTNTIICYIKGNEDVVLPNFPRDMKWNNKKWRMWLYLADEHNALMAGRQYPFIVDGALQPIRETFFALLGYRGYNWTNWHHDIITEYTYKDGTEETIPCDDLLVINKHFIPRKEVITDGSKLHYNDLLHSSYYTPFYAWRKTTQAIIHFTVGGPVKCLACGKHNLEDSERMVCDNCDDYCYCDCCGDRIRRSDAYEVINGGLVCGYCFNNHYVRCAHCGEYIHEDDAYYCDRDDNYYCEEHYPN